MAGAWGQAAEVVAKAADVTAKYDDPGHREPGNDHTMDYPVWYVPYLTAALLIPLIAAPHVMVAPVAGSAARGKATTGQ